MIQQGFTVQAGIAEVMVRPHVEIVSPLSEDFGAQAVLGDIV